MEVDQGEGIRLGQDRWERGEGGRTKGYRRCSSPFFLFYFLFFQNNFVLKPIVGTKRGRNLYRGEGEAITQDQREARGHVLPGEGGAAQCEKWVPSRVSPEEGIRAEERMVEERSSQLHTGEVIK